MLGRRGKAGDGSEGGQATLCTWIIHTILTYLKMLMELAMPQIGPICGSASGSSVIRRCVCLSVNGHAPCVM